MKKIGSLLLFFILGSGLFAQEWMQNVTWIKIQEFPIEKKEIWTVDALDFVYITKNNILEKFDYTANLLFSQSIKSVGRILQLEPINTMKMVAFSEEQQVVCILDNTLTLSEECLDLAQLDIGNASFMATSSQSDKIWIVDQLNSRLLLLSLSNTQQFQEIKNVQGVLNMQEIEEITERNNHLFVRDKAGAIFQFDRFGSLLNRYKFEEMEAFSCTENSLVVLQKNKLILLDFRSQNTREILLPVEEIIEFKMVGNFFYFRLENKIVKYALD